MKQGYFIILTVLTLSFLLMPLLAVEDKSSALSETPTSASKEEENKEEQEKHNIIKLYISETGKTEEIGAEDYIMGVVAAEMPAEYHEEALKAQAVAAYTYLCRKQGENSDKEYEITDDSTIDQGYISKEKRYERWGDNAETYENKISAAVKAVSGKILTYEGKPILAAYHAISPGKTESAMNVWNVDLPYLKPVSSVGDLLVDGFLSEAVISVEDFKKAITELGASPENEPSSYIGEATKSESGTVLKINICGKEISGTELRNKLGLRSAAFDMSFSAEKGFVFTVKGYGHGVGMSQTGANYLAKQGKNYEDILKFYYSGVEISG